MVQQDKVIYDDREPVVRSNPVGRIAGNCALGAVGASLIRLWLPGIELMTVVIEVFVIVLAGMAVGLGIRGLLLARKRDLAAGGAITGLGIGLMTLVMIPLVVYVLNPAAHAARQSKVCLKNLELLGGAAAEYARNHPGETVAATPQVLAGMQAANGFNATRLVCPMDPKRPERNTRAEHCSYAWIAGQPFGDPDHVLAYCACKAHGGGTNVLMADGTVKFLSHEKLAEALRRTQGDIDAATRPATGTGPANR